MALKGIQKVEYSTNYNWAAGSGTFTEITISDILKEGFSMGEPEEFITELANETEDLDGVKYTGTMQLKYDAAQKPPQQSGVWFRVTPDAGAAQVIGGVNGCTVRYARGGMRPLSQGQWFERMTFTYAGATSADVIKAG